MVSELCHGNLKKRFLRSIYCINLRYYWSIVWRDKKRLEGLLHEKVNPSNNVRIFCCVYMRFVNQDKLHMLSPPLHSTMMTDEIHLCLHVYLPPG